MGTNGIPSLFLELIHCVLFLFFVLWLVSLMVFVSKEKWTRTRTLIHHGWQTRRFLREMGDHITVGQVPISHYLVSPKVCAGILLLHPHGFALPHYSDSNKIGYVLQGSCTVGMVSPSASKEKVVVIKEGDAIPVPIELVSWWFNAGDSDTIIVFIGESSISQISGEMTYFFLTGTVGVLRGFSTEFISKAYNLNQNEANTLVTNQTGGVVVKLSEGIQIPQPQNYAKHYDEFASTLTTAVEFTSLEQVGLSFKHLKLGGNAVFSLST